jgi:Fur family transcriptional regulator, stress-responsive regulator
MALTRRSPYSASIGLKAHDFITDGSDGVWRRLTPPATRSPPHALPVLSGGERAAPATPSHSPDSDQLFSREPLGHSKPGLEDPAIDVVGPQDLGDVVGLVVGPGRDPASDCGVGDVNPLVAQRVVKHPRIRDLAREGNPDTGTGRVRVDGGPAGGEQDRAAPGLAHRPDDRLCCGYRAEHAELERATDVFDRRLQDRLHELWRGQRRILEHLDRPEFLGKPMDGARQRVAVADVGRRAGRGDAVEPQPGCKFDQSRLRARDQAYGEAFASEPPGHGETEVRAGADDHERHVPEPTGERTRRQSRALALIRIDSRILWHTAGMPATSELEGMLRGASLRVTRPRVAVLAAVHEHPHADTHSIIGLVREDLGQVSHQTVYDVLRALTAAGLLRLIHPPGSVARYESRVGDNHHHLVCRSCGAIADVDSAVGSAPCLTAADHHGYAIDEAEVIYRGLCPGCSIAHSA